MRGPCKVRDAAAFDPFTFMKIRLMDQNISNDLNSMTPFSRVKARVGSSLAQALRLGTEAFAEVFSAGWDQERVLIPVRCRRSRSSTGGTDRPGRPRGSAGWW